jgi:hypothetical protein
MRPASTATDMPLRPSGSVALVIRRSSMRRPWIPACAGMTD